METPKKKPLFKGSKKEIEEQFAALEQQAADAAANGNGRMARNVLEKAILNQAKRLIADADADLALLLPGDFELD